MAKKKQKTEPKKAEPAYVEPKYAFDDTHKVTHVSMCPPAVRTVVIEAWADDDKTPPAAVVYPVIALQTIISDTYSRRRLLANRSDVARTAGTHDELVAAGWMLAFQNNVVEAVYVDSDDMPPIRTTAHEVANVVTRVVVCPWPPEEDDSRLQVHIEKAVCEAKELAARIS